MMNVISDNRAERLEIFISSDLEKVKVGLKVNIEKAKVENFHKRP